MQEEYYRIGAWREYVAKYDILGSKEMTEEVTLDPKTTVLLVIDVQRKAWDRHVSRGWGRIFQEQAAELAKAYFDHIEQTVLPNIKRLLGFFRQQGLRRVFFTVGPHLPTCEDVPRAERRGHCGIHVRSPEYKVVDALAPQSSELVFQKVTRSGFVGTGADLILRNLGIENMVLVGGSISNCVEATGRSAADLGFNVVLVEDSCSGYMPLLHDATLIQFESFLGRVLSTQEVIEELQENLEQQGRVAGATHAIGRPV